ncbi:MAG TPA: hypothetical protein VIH90_05500 [Candidatus Saccharimonadales bacterium]
MNAVEQRTPNGIRVLRKKIKPSILPELRTELAEYWQSQKIDVTAVKSTRGRRLEEVTEHLGTVTTKLFTDLGIPNDSLLFVNLQPPGAKQFFHPDGTNAVVLYPQGVGTYDYATSEMAHKSIAVSAGDVITSTAPNLVHRGHNTGTEDRLTVALLTHGSIPVPLQS